MDRTLVLALIPLAPEKDYVPSYFLSITKSAVRSLSGRGDCCLLKPYRIFTNFPVDFY